MQTEPEHVVLIIADISGYTRYMKANAKSLAHSQAVITELIGTVIKQVELPLAVAKLEGDAVFLYARKNNGLVSWDQSRQTIGRKLVQFFEAFSAKIAELRQATMCGCGACLNLNQLKLKLVVHSGEVLIHNVFGFLELAGVDVIIVHRLLKNSVRTDQYIVLTAAAREDISLPGCFQLEAGRERYEDIGEVPIFIHRFESTRECALRTITPKPEKSMGNRLLPTWRWYLKLWFAPLRPATQEGTGALFPRIAYTLFTLVFTPLFVPVGLLLISVRMILPSAPVALSSET